MTMMKVLLRLRIQTILLLSFVLNAQGIIIINGEDRGEFINGDNDEPPPPRQLITNGVRVDPGTYPFFTFNKFGQGKGCGGALIHEDILVSAGHCRQVYEGRGAYVGAATNFGYDDGDEIFHEDDLVVLHPHFDSTFFHNDIMLIKLQTPSNQTPVQLNRDGNLPVRGMPLTVMGFGDTTFNGALSPNLLQAEVSVYDFDKCTQIYAAESVVLDQQAQFCALDETGSGRDSCQGDSGSPIIDERGVQMGIVSFGLGCGQVGVPATYTRIAPYMDWIDEQVCLLSANPPAQCINTTFDNDIHSNTTDSSSGSINDHNDTIIDNFVETNATEAVCGLGSDCSQRCDYAIKAVETCFDNRTSKGDVGDGFDACMACTRLQNITSLLDLGEIAPQDYMDQACLNIMTCQDDCGVCFEDALEFGWCAWDCDDVGGSSNSTFGNATNEPTLLFPPSNVSTSTPSPSSDIPSLAPSLLNNETNELKGKPNSTTFPSLEPSASPLIPTLEPTVPSNIFDRPEPTASPTMSPSTAPTVTYKESVTFAFRGIKGPLDDEQIKAFEQGTEHFLQLAGDATVQVDYLYESSQTVRGDEELWWLLTTVVSSTQNDRPGVTSVDVINRSEQSALNYRGVLVQQDDMFIDITGIKARLTSDNPTTAVSSGNNNDDDDDDDIDNVFWYAIGMLALAVFVAVLVTIKFVRALRAPGNDNQDCQETSEAYLYDRNEYVGDDDAEEEDFIPEEFDPSQDEYVSDEDAEGENFIPETFDEEYDPSRDPRGLSKMSNMGIL